MKLACNISVSNRLQTTLAVNSQRRHVKSTLALCKNPKSDDYCIIHFFGQNKNGTKYNLKQNINQILTRFVHEGKATISFKSPPNDLLIQADVIPLKAFLHLLKRALENKIQQNEFTYSSMSVMPFTTKDLAPKKLVIKTRSDYPTKGFPRTLEVLFINSVSRCSLDRGILQLTKLKTLDLSHNLIECLPEELNKLPSLVELNLSENCLFKSAPNQWGWMGGNLAKSLQMLCLDSNQLKYLPDQIIKLQKLLSLHVNHNELTNLPNGIGKLNLKVLSVSNNQLTVLPGSVRNFSLENLDLSRNNLKIERAGQDPPPSPKVFTICSLKDLAGKEVLNSKQTYNSENLPVNLVKFLDCAKYCVCGKACFDIFLCVPQFILCDTITKNYCVSSDDGRFVPVNCYFCSWKCFQCSSRYRKPVIR